MRLRTGADRREDFVRSSITDSAQVYADLAVLSAHPRLMIRVWRINCSGEWDRAEACSATDWAGARAA
ncbi:MAG: hypothetical protein R3E03_05680 [Novosphingobium sp.]